MKRSSAVISFNYVGNVFLGFDLQEKRKTGRYQSPNAIEVYWRKLYKHKKITREGRECYICGNFKSWSEFDLSKELPGEKNPHCQNCEELVEDFHKVFWGWYESQKRKGYTEARQYALQKGKPPWLELEAIRNIYKECLRVSEKGKTKYHVDHIVPLQGQYHGLQVVCGLHCQENLHIITRKKNLGKHNGFWPDMPKYRHNDIEELKARLIEVGGGNKQYRDLYAEFYELNIWSKYYKAWRSKKKKLVSKSTRNTEVSNRKTDSGKKDHPWIGSTSLWKVSVLSYKAIDSKTLTEIAHPGGHYLKGFSQTIAPRKQNCSMWGLIDCEIERDNPGAIFGMWMPIDFNTT